MSCLLERGEPVKFQVHDVELEERDLIRIHHFSFLKTEAGLVPPRKIRLSPNRRLLLLLGIQYRSQSCLVV